MNPILNLENNPLPSSNFVRRGPEVLVDRNIVPAGTHRDQRPETRDQRPETSQRPETRETRRTEEQNRRTELAVKILAQIYGVTNFSKKVNAKTENWDPWDP